jgi:hypothetical protein
MGAIGNIVGIWSASVAGLYFVLRLAANDHFTDCWQPVSREAANHHFTDRWLLLDLFKFFPGFPPTLCCVQWLSQVVYMVQV